MKTSSFSTINPANGKVFEARTDIHKDYPADDFHAASPVWNAATKTSWAISSQRWLSQISRRIMLSTGR